MITQIRKIQDAKSGDVIVVSDNRNDAMEWCKKIPNGNTLKIKTTEGITIVRYAL